MKSTALTNTFFGFLLSAGWLISYFFKWKHLIIQPVEGILPVTGCFFRFCRMKRQNNHILASECTPRSILNLLKEKRLINIALLPKQQYSNEYLRNYYSPIALVNLSAINYRASVQSKNSSDKELLVRQIHKMMCFSFHRASYKWIREDSRNFTQTNIIVWTFTSDCHY